MEQTLSQVTPFLRRCGMAPEDVDFATMTNLFLGQMRIGLYGGASSIPMRPTDLSPSGSWPLMEPVAVVEISERDIRTALVTFTDRSPIIRLGDSFPMSDAERPSPFEDLIYAIATLLEPLIQESHAIALCLPFPLEKTAGGDFTILPSSLSIGIVDWEGKGICASLREELTSRGLSIKPILPIHTVSALLLGGMATQNKENRYLSLTWGHRVDSGLSAPKSAILKLKSGETKLMLLQCGSGGLTGVPFGVIDLVMDRDSQFPGKDLLDKMVSTENLGELYRFTMIKAVEADLLTFMCGRDFLSLRKLSLSSLSQFLAEPEGDNLLANFCRHDETDKAVSLSIARAVLQRAARLVCANLAATLILTGAGRTKDAPALVSVSGSAFSHPFLGNLFAECVTAFIEGELNLHCKLHHDPDSVLIGGAVAVLLNA
ncbi:MAG: Hexokinase [Evtepia sp.]|jgi:hexokinase|nr:Hexokinase [Evtepia sp.]